MSILFIFFFLFKKNKARSFFLSTFNPLKGLNINLHCSYILIHFMSKAQTCNYIETTNLHLDKKSRGRKSATFSWKYHHAVTYKYSLRSYSVKWEEWEVLESLQFSSKHRRCSMVYYSMMNKILVSGYYKFVLIT